MKSTITALLIGASVLTLAGCSKPAADDSAAAATGTTSDVAGAETAVQGNPDNNAYFGNVHVHTGYSFDALTNGSKTVPKDAYAWAQGKEITNSGIGGKIQIVTPLDFYAVSEHAEFMGVFNQMSDPDSPLSKHPLAAGVTSKDNAIAVATFGQILRDMSAGKRDPALTDPKLAATVWAEIVKAADDAYTPGKFTTFAGFEWSSNPQRRNLHRVVVFRDTAHLPEVVLSSLDSSDPESLWAWMGQQRANGSTLFAIPHNANASDGRMFELVKFDGKPIDAAYNKTRAENEPLYEISQIKGTSETWPGLSPNDEFAGFEQWNYILSADFERPTNHKGSVARQALLDGLSQAAAGNGNPFKYGFIGDTDTHNAAGSNEEFNNTGKFAHENDPRYALGGAPGMREGQVQQFREFSSGGLAGVWAEKNTRGAIFDAMQRKETFGTSGTMIKVRFFGGWDFAPGDVGASDFVQRGYKRGVPMGRDLQGSGKAPTFMVSAIKDPKSGNLDRIQIVKGWLDASGKQHEKIYDVVWSGERKPASNGKVPAVGNTVDLQTGKYTNSIGAATLATTWTDPEFDPKQRAFYYARVLEIPTPRWSTLAAIKIGQAPPAKIATTIQERAWSSPIWYQPG